MEGSRRIIELENGLNEGLHLPRKTEVGLSSVLTPAENKAELALCAKTDGAKTQILHGNSKCRNELESCLNQGHLPLERANCLSLIGPQTTSTSHLVCDRNRTLIRPNIRGHG